VRSAYTYSTIEQAQEALDTAALDVAADFGEEMVEAAWPDLVESIAADCAPDVAAELRRRSL
jgi:hypothetical protein